MNSTVQLILGMTLVTYIPRLIPFILVSSESLPKGIKKFLLCIPCTALGALIIPGVFYATPNMPLASIVGIGFAAIYSWYKGGIIIPVLGSVVATFIMLTIF